ncbi:DUF6064 family protein [Candidatus Babeliales bacterium]|nr:DUF6064 family protein [Candidatus Babeliales bacterium]
MALPFTIEQFLGTIQQYNLSVFPMQIVLLLLGIASIFLVFKQIKNNNKIIPGILAFFWIWIGIVYHLIFFTSINKAAYLFGDLFIIQGLLFLFVGFKDKLSFKFRKDVYGITGSIFVLYAIIIYPILNYIFGHWWPLNPTFGLPCPTTIFTFGLLLWTNKKIPKYILIIPLLWALIGMSAAINLGIWEDLGLIATGVLGVILLWTRDRKR